MKRLVTIIAAATLLLFSCGKKQPTANGWSDTIPVSVMIVNSSEAPTERNYVGDITSEKIIELGFPLGGTLTKVNVHNGQHVASGQVIAVADSTTMSSLHATARATLRQAEDAYRRMEAVYKEGGISDVRWIQMETDLEKARQAEVSARKRVEDCTLRAPFSGVVSCLDRHVGQDLRPGEVFARVLDMNKLRVSDKSLVANPLGHTYRVNATVVESDVRELLPDMVAKVHTSHKSSTGTVVPSSCVHTMPEGQVVWVIENGVARQRVIGVGDFVKCGVLVTEGLSDGDTVVTGGHQKLYSGAKVTVK